MEKQQIRKSHHRLSRSLSQTFHNLRRSSSIIKEIPKDIIQSTSKNKKILTNKIWIEDIDEIKWKLYLILSQEENEIIVQEIQRDSTTSSSILNDHKNENNMKKIQNPKSLNLAFIDIFPYNELFVSDMSTMRYLNEPTIIYNIQQRYLNKLPYTYMGSVLITANPFEWYHNLRPIDFIGKCIDTENPHPYAIAELSFQQICLNKPVDQSIVISGESGAGKTETAKMILSYLAGRATGLFEEADTLNSVEAKLLHSSPILESFGNAQTSRNNNSSRFGKYVKIVFSTPTASEQKKSKEIIGAMIETYLLEKSRITGQPHKERNFHIFYLLLQALKSDASILGSLHLSSVLPTDYAILSDGNGSPVENVVPFSAIVNALNEFNFSSERIESVWRLLGAILELGNIEFYDADEPTGIAAKISEKSQHHLHVAAALLSVSVDDLLLVLLTREMKTGREIFTIPLKFRESLNARNAFLKTLYSNLFTEIVSSVNQKLSNCVATNTNTISVLDIFGFECFEQNDFEQFLINYANEALQCTFNEQIFQNDLRLFQEEHIEVNLIIEDCPSNIHCVNLIASPLKSSQSVLSILQSVGQLSTGTDESFCENLHTAFGRSKDSEIKKYFLNVHPKDRNRLFAIKHYAGKVTYTVGSKESNTWLNKNHDYIPEGLLRVLLSSNLELIQKVSGITSIESTRDIASKRNLLVEKKSTVADRFVMSMNELFTSLRASSCSFIKCIKPNRLLKPLCFDETYVIEQVRSLGLVQVCEIMKVGLPIRIPFNDILTKYQSVYSETQHLFHGIQDPIFISALMYALKVPYESYRLGKNRLFFTSNSFEIVDSIMSFDDTADPENLKKIIEDVTEGMIIQKQSSEMIQNIQDRLLKLNENITNMKIKVDGFDSLIRTVTGDLEIIHNDIYTTKSMIDGITEIIPCGRDNLSQIKFKLFQFDTSSRSSTSTSTTMSSFENEMNLIHEQYSNILNIQENNEKMWELIGNKYLWVDDRTLNEKSEEVRIMSSKLLKISSEIDDIMPHVRHLIEKTQRRADRAPILKVENWINDCEHNFSLIMTQLDRMDDLMRSGQEMANDLTKSIQIIKEVIFELISMSEEIKKSNIEMMIKCKNIESEITHLLDEIQKSEQERELQVTEETLRIEEYERIKNENLVIEENKLIVEQEIEEVNEIIGDYDFTEEVDLPPGWEKVINPQSSKWEYRSLLTHQYQSEYPLSPAKTRDMNDMEIVEEYQQLTSTQSIGNSLPNKPKRLSFISVDPIDILPDNEIENIDSHENKSLHDDTLTSKISSSLSSSHTTSTSPSISEKNSSTTSTGTGTSTSDKKTIIPKSTLKKLFSIVREDIIIENNPEIILGVFKKGILYKQGKLFGIWKKIYIVLDGNNLEQYPSSQAYHSGSLPSKKLLLSGKSVLSYTKYSNCFTIYNETISWVLMTENEVEFMEWMNSLNTIITALFHERIENVRLSSIQSSSSSNLPSSTTPPTPTSAISNTSK